jgi:long-subunit fatty acid transport protein
MNKKGDHLLIVFVCFFILSAVPLSAQLTLGQYEDEAPFRTWNTFGIPSASSIGKGEAQFAIVGDASATLVNPARLTELPRFSATINGAYTASSFDKYSVVNTGVIITDGNSSLGMYSVDFAGVTLHTGGWGLGVSIGLLESYERPSQSIDYVENGEVQYLFEFRQKGILRNVNASLAREVGDWLSIGLGVNYVYGSMEKEIVEYLYYTGITISDRKTHDFRGFFLNGGLSADITDKLTVAAVFRTPFSKKADSESKLRYDSRPGATDIRIEAAAQNKYEQPWIFGVGADYRFSPKLRVAADASFFNWTSYSIAYFEEEIDREFRNIMKVSGGLEYAGSVTLFRQNLQVPLRVGIGYDPQPIKQPKIHYTYYTLGFGLIWKGLHLDAGMAIGTEKGSGYDLYGRKFSVCLSYFL